MFQAFLQEVKDHFQANQTVVLALSGGVDSMVLLDLLCRLPDGIRPHIVLAHLNHKLRTESDKEEQAIRELAEEKHLPLYCKSWTHHPEVGIEEAGRRARYTFFAEVMDELAADYLLTAHHKNDQAETLMMRLIRGGRYQRMRGIEKLRPFADAQIYRPLLAFEKQTLYHYAAEKQLVYFEDKSNQSFAYTRNRYRNKIMPLLEAENSQAVEHIASFATDMQEMDDIIQAVVSDQLASLCTAGVLSRSPLLAKPNSLAKLILDAFIANYSEEHLEISPDMVQKAMDWLVDSQPNASFQLPAGYLLKRSYENIRLTQQSQLEKDQNDGFKSLQLNSWQKLNATERVGVFTIDKLPALQAGDKYIKVARDSVQPPFMLRHRRPGDRMSLKGLPQAHKKIKDIFIDQKVPLALRDNAYLITDSQNVIIWLLGFKESALSIPFETDTISYVFVYRK